MNALFDKLQALGQELEREFGPITVYGLFFRRGVLNKWDLVIAADWVPEGIRDGIDLLLPRVQALLTPEEFLELGHLVAMRPEGPFINELLELVQDQPGVRVFRNVELNDMEMNRVVLFIAPTPSHSSQAIPVAA